MVEETWFAWDGDTLAEQTTTGTSGAGGGESGMAAREVLSWVHDGLAPVAQARLSTTAGTSPGGDVGVSGAGVGDGRHGDDSAGDGGLVGGAAAAGVSPDGSGWLQEEVDAEFFAIVTDLVGAPSEPVDESGGLVWRARRTVWGAPVDPAQAGPVRLRFRGQYADAESGLCYNRFRYYDPGTGRYTSPDPLGLAPAPNPVAYVDNPTTIESLGLAPCSPGSDNSPAGQARSSQGQGRYPGVDDWTNVVLPEGTVVHAGEPGVSGFFTSDEMAASAGSDARALNEDLRVAPFHGTYGPGLTAFRLTEDVAAARSVAIADPKFAAGGFTQYFIPGWETKIQATLTRIMAGGPK